MIFWNMNLLALSEAFINIKEEIGQIKSLLEQNIWSPLAVSLNYQFLDADQRKASHFSVLIPV